MAGERQETGFTCICFFCSLSGADQFLFSFRASLDLQAQFGINCVNFFSTLFDPVLQIDVRFFESLLYLNVTGDVIEASNEAAAGQWVTHHFNNATILPLASESMLSTRAQMIHTFIDFGFYMAGSALSALSVIADEGRYRSSDLQHAIWILKHITITFVPCNEF